MPERELPEPKKRKKSKREVFNKNCNECIHEHACELWAGGRMAARNATICQFYEMVKSSNAYFCGFLDGQKSIKEDENGRS